MTLYFKMAISSLVLLAVLVQLSISQDFCSTTFDVDAFHYYTSIAGRQLGKTIDLNEGPRIKGTNFSEPSFEFSQGPGLKIDDTKLVNGIRNVTCSSNELTLYGTVFFKKYEFGGPVIEIVSNHSTFMSMSVCRSSNEITLSYKHLGNLTFETIPYKFSLGKWYKLAAILSGNLMSVFVNCTEVAHKTIPLPDYCPPEKSDLVVSIAQTKLTKEQITPCSTKFTGSLERVGVWCGTKGLSKQCPNFANGVVCPICGPHLSMIKKYNNVQSLTKSLQTELNSCKKDLSDSKNKSCSSDQFRSCLIEQTTYTDGSFAKKTNGEICYCRDGNPICVNPNSISEPPTPMTATVVPNTTSSEPTKVPTSEETCSYQYNGQTYSIVLNKKIYVPDGSKCTTLHCTGGSFGRVVAKSQHSCSDVQCSSLVSEEDKQIATCCGSCSPCDFVTCPSNSECHVTGQSHECRCKSGYELINDGCVDRDECALGKQQGGHDCPDIAQCKNTNGSYECICPEGYDIVSNSGVPSCQDINECLTHDCGSNAECVNDVPGYHCKCDTNYTFTDGKCRAVCSNKCQNNGECTAPDVCSCFPGYTGKYCEFDINECEVFAGSVCNESNANCVNTDGGYFCHCQKGFQLNATTNKCQDVNECLTGAHDCISGCHNVIGEEGYFCLCGGNNSGPSCPGQCKWGNEMLSNTENRTVGCDIIVCKDGNIKRQKKICDCITSDVDTECCPQCVQTDVCKVDKGRTFIKEGEFYIDPNNRCIQQKCAKVDGKLTLINRITNCPPVGPCPSNYTYTPKGSCCEICQLPVCTNDNKGVTVDIKCEKATCDGNNWTFTKITTCPSVDNCPKELVITLPGTCCPICETSLQSCNIN